MPTSEYNTLIVSDLHLGEDLTKVACEANTLHVNIVERELIGFLHYYARRREDGRPWRLIVNGDMVDFLSIGIFPDHPDFVDYQPTVEEIEFGLRRTPAVAIAKMKAVIVRHQNVFRALARFLSRGNKVEIISGNHDTEFHWKGTQDAMSQGIAQAWESMQASLRPGAMSAEDVISGLDFHPWFFHEPGVLWVEHGHQYDECCSLRHQLYPRCPETDEIVTNVDTAGVRYVTSYIAEAESQNMDLWSFMAYVRFGIGLGLRGCLRLIFGYFTFSKVLLQVWKRERMPSKEKRRVRAAHKERLGTLATEKGMAETTLRKLDDLARIPVVNRLSKLSSVLMLDKLLFYGLGLVVALLSMVVLSGALALAGVVTGIMLGAGLSVWSSWGREVDASAMMELNAERIVKIVDAKYIIFGHTHEPVAQQHKDGTWYFNTGTWVPTGKPGLLRAFTHMVVHHRANGPEAELCQWRDGASRGFTPNWRPGDQGSRVVPQKVPAPVASAHSLAS